MKLLTFFINKQYLNSEVYKALVHSAESSPKKTRRYSTPALAPSGSEKSSSGPVFFSEWLLHTVQLANIYNDSKTFVDQPLRFPPAKVESNFSIFMAAHQDKPDQTQLRKFVSENFLEHGHELEDWIPTDYVENPKFLTQIEDTNFRRFAKSVHGIWKTLGRKISTFVRDHQDRHSLLYVPHPFIIPGGRFREFYYWDSYWIQKGLLVSDMPDTVRGMLGNFLDLVDRLGYVPNGGRTYYNRTQPPLLIPMFQNYLEATSDIQFLNESLPLLEKEFQFWIRERMVNVEVSGVKYSLARYNSSAKYPRPESYREDYLLGSKLQTDAEREELYANLHSGAESGWDFSSRWYTSDRKSGTLVDIKTTQIIPVDLNGFLYLNAKLLSQFFTLVAKPEEAKKYKEIASNFKEAINAVLWDEEIGSWFDYDLTKGCVNTDFYPTTIVPLWAGIAEPGDVRHQRVTNYLKSMKIFDFPGGVPTSLQESGEQWNFPNAWSPLQSLLVDGLEAGDSESQELAFQLAQKWLASNYKGFHESNSMFEKYDVTAPGAFGGGGEYVVQEGFGWTNGVALDFLARYGQRVRLPASK